jgi:hypothetical protein
VFSATAANPLIDVAVDIGCGLLAVLLVPLLAGLGALLGTLDGDTGLRFPIADRGWSMSRRLGTNGVMGGDAAPSFSGALGGISQCVEGSQKCSAMCMASGHLTSILQGHGKASSVC